MDTIDPTLVTLLEAQGIHLEKEQPHISGERFLLSPDKLVLMGHGQEGRSLVIKASNKSGARGSEEIVREKQIRDTLERIPFAKDTLLIPRERLYIQTGGYTILATDFIEQEKIFTHHSLEEQFFLVLRAFEAQEAFHATTYEHVQQLLPVFSRTTPEQYVEKFAEFSKTVEREFPQGNLQSAFATADALLRSHHSVLLRYSNYLTHTDFVPHNMRISGRSVYVLDQVAIEFANKYEGWARLLNYLIVHNPALEALLVAHLKKNRSADEYADFMLMRIYKVGYLLNYYAHTLPKTSGDLHELTLERLTLWGSVLRSFVEETPFDPELVTHYKEKRALLRSEEEKERQRYFADA